MNAPSKFPVVESPTDEAWNKAIEETKQLYSEALKGLA
jgi:hypothetical protein